MDYSSVFTRDGYAQDVVEGFANKQEAMDFARDNGHNYVVRGTQMWNKRLGVIEESFNDSKYWVVR